MNTPIDATPVCDKACVPARQIANEVATGRYVGGFIPLELAENMERELRALKQVRESDWDDDADKWSPDIEQALPQLHTAVRADWARYEQALEMVSHRHGKYELVELVNWLLKELAHHRDK